MDIFYWDFNKVSKMSTWNPKLKSTCINFQKLTNHSQFGYETFVKDKYFDDFGNA
jgi:hypothetical protein